MKIGHHEIRTLETGLFKLDGGAMFGTVPKTLWEKAIPPDENNRIPMALRIVLLRNFETGRNLLIDTGIGDKWTPKLREIYGIDHSSDSLDKSLAKAGVKAEEITDVILSHLHFDHTGGSTKAKAPGSTEFVPTFANAIYYIQKENYDWASKPNSRESASYLSENFKPLEARGLLKICDGIRGLEAALNWPGISVRLSYGHTIGLQCPLIDIDGEKFFYPSDLIPTSAHLPVPWVMGYDIHVIRLLDEKESILEEAVKDNWTMIYEHDPQITASKVIKGPKHFGRGAVVDLS